MTDDELLAQVHEAFALLDPVPVAVPAAGRAAIGWRLPGAVPAELVADQDPGCAGLRGGTRLLTFAYADGQAVLEVLGEGDEVELAGQFGSPGPADVVVRHPAGELSGAVDRDGRFIISSVPSGPVSLVFRWPDATSVVTSWVLL